MAGFIAGVCQPPGVAWAMPSAVIVSGGKGDASRRWQRCQGRHQRVSLAGPTRRGLLGPSRPSGSDRDARATSPRRSPPSRRTNGQKVRTRRTSIDSIATGGQPNGGTREVLPKRDRGETRGSGRTMDRDEQRRLQLLYGGNAADRKGNARPLRKTRPRSTQAGAGSSPSSRRIAPAS